MRIKNWERFQHYKTGKNAARRPEWIKLYTGLLDDLEFHKLQPQAAKVVLMLWMLASEYDGELPDIETIAFRLRYSKDEIAQIVAGLTHWLEDCPRTVLGTSYDDARTDKEEETEKEVEKNKKVGGADAPLAAANGYAFHGSIIKLKAKDRDQWRRAYSHLDLEAELIARDAWLLDHPDGQKSWFASTSKYLANRNAEAKARASPLAAKRSPYMEAAREIYEDIQENAAASLITHRGN